jgi:hypothetical protein
MARICTNPAVLRQVEEYELRACRLRTLAQERDGLIAVAQIDRLVSDALVDGAERHLIPSAPLLV